MIRYISFKTRQNIVLIVFVLFYCMILRGSYPI